MKFIGTLFVTISIFGVGPEDSNDLGEETTIHSPQEMLRGIVLVNDSSSIHETDLTTAFLFVQEGVHLPGSFEALKQRLEPLIVNKEIHQETLLLIKNEILKYYTEHRQPMVAIEIPEQEVSSGVVVFTIRGAQLGEITYSGNHWFSQTRVEKQLSLQSGEPFDQNQLLNNVAWLNQNPFHYTDVTLSPGIEKGETNVCIETKDRFPLRVYVGGDNTGTESTGTSRFRAGFTWGNGFFVDDLLSYQFTSNVNYNKFHSHSLTYVSFLPWKHSLSIYGGYAEIHPGITDFRSDGKEAQASIRYKIPFKPLYTHFQHQLYFGFDYKYITSALFFVAELIPTSIKNSIVNVTQEMVGYSLEYTPKQHQFMFRLELFGSPAKWLPHQGNHTYSALRPDAKPRYFYGKIVLSDTHTFAAKHSISTLLRVQGAANTLIPSEQFSLGGYDTVRGYKENVFISDNAICANLELRLCPLTLFKKIKDELTLLAFMDYGWGYNYHPFDGITTAATLWSVGPGLRYSIAPYAMLRLDYGFKLHRVAFDTSSLGMWHVAGTLSY